MSKTPLVAIPIRMRDWVFGVEPGPVRRQRQAIEIALNTIATCQDLAKSCSLKGGILMGLLHGSPRLTGDIDLSLSAMPTPETPDEFREVLDSHFSFVALELGYPEIAMKVHSIKKLPKRKFDEATFPGLQLKLNFVDTRNSVQLAAFKKGTPIEIVDMDVSFNEPAEDLTILKLSNEREILAYGIAELLAEKYRALHQQITRSRNRRQDAYDIWWLYTNKDIDEGVRERTLTRLKEKSITRGVHVAPRTIENNEIRDRAEAEWETQRLELGDELPAFNICWEAVLSLYNQLPWEKKK